MSSEAVMTSSEIEHLREAQIVMYHGTRASAAVEIARSGFTSVPVETQIEAVVVESGFDVTQLRTDLTKHGRFAVLDPRGHGDVFVTGDRARAGSYASRGPEARWESLWSAFRLQHDLGHDWNASDEGHLWVMAQDLEDPAVVVECVTTIGALRDKHDTPATEMLARLIASGDTIDGAIEYISRRAEWRVGPRRISFVSAEHVPFRVGHQLMLFMDGGSQQSFNDRLSAGVLGCPRGLPPDE
ncbi:hypothetical protein SAMN04488550_2583 [Gordonia malaquae]|uniref:Uncharacterized protein n=1 Tax=Gordonia malaquae NBRC 108250 TaxID=1223542 RepID=M3VHB9_GORML|nr:hypothetical protein [Gordonia malaquae]GAC81774.1 hypothetical protein GM1_044_00220 [Gordonia malaquae NBRC 108250]SED47598.1 hypothetical protein SAMN04488550_2583 [Gordonia malaquae]